MYLEVIDGYTAKLGADHVDTVTAKMNLAELYRTQGEFEIAKPMFLEVIDIRTAKLAADHFDTVRAKLNLAILFFFQAEDGIRDSPE
eukprot:COSAG01_NODE_48794_length_378_cov_0.494624_1_plen_87_part_00